MKPWWWMRNPESGSNAQEEVKLKVSFPKVLLMSAVAMVCLVVALWAIGMRFGDPVLVVFLIVMLPTMAFAFAGCLYFMLQCKIGPEGLRPVVPFLPNGVSMG